MYKHSQNDKSVFHIIPQDFVDKQDISMDLQVCIDFVKPSSKIEVMQASETPRYSLFVPKVRTKEFAVKQVSSDGADDGDKGRKFVLEQSAFAGW